jgi:hypothetical protein
MFPTAPGFEPSPAWGEEIIFDAPANPHNPMMDAQGRVWLTSTVRRRDNPDWCKAGSDHPSADYFPVSRSGRQISAYDPEGQSWLLIDSCYATHHLQFGEDADDTLWFSGDSNVVGWLDTKLYDETGDERAAVERAGRTGRSGSGYPRRRVCLWRHCQPCGRVGVDRAHRAVSGPARPTGPG